MLIRFHTGSFISTRSSYNRIHSLFSPISFYLNCTKFNPIPLTWLTNVKHTAVGMSGYKRWRLCNWLSHKKWVGWRGRTLWCPKSITMKMVHYCLQNTGGLLRAHIHIYTHTWGQPEKAVPTPMVTQENESWLNDRLVSTGGSEA